MRDPAINQAAFDRYSSAHAGFGVLFAAHDVSFWGALAISVAFELVENELKEAYGEVFPHSSRDSLENSIGDTLSLLAGYVVAKTAIDKGLSKREKRALQATVASTIGGFVGGVGTGATMTPRAGEKAPNVPQAPSTWAEAGYQAGAAVGGAYGARQGDKKSLTPAAVAAVGGYVAGPIGAGLLTLLVP